MEAFKRDKCNKAENSIFLLGQARYTKYLFKFFQLCFLSESDTRGKCFKVFQRVFHRTKSHVSIAKGTLNVYSTLLDVNCTVLQDTVLKFMFAFILTR